MLEPDRSRVLVLALCLAAFLGGLGCDENLTHIDARFSTPEHTVDTLLGAYGVSELPQDDLRARIATQGGLTLQDREAYAGCFVDLARPGGEGMAGYVLGMLAAARDDLRFETAGDRGYAFPREGIRVVMIRGEDRTYRISLAESVPEEVQRGLLQVEENAGHRIPRDSVP